MAITSGQWREAPERGSVLALWLIYWIGKYLGRDVARTVLYLISLYFVVLAPGARHGSVLYLRRVLGREPGWRDVFQHIYTFAATILDRVFFLAGDIGRFDIRIHNGALIQQKIDSGSGCILLGSHLGSFEALRVLGIIGRQLPLKVVMDVEQNAAITRFLNALNPEIADTIIPRSGAATLLAIQEKVAQGYMIGVLGDRVVAAGATVSCRFLGSNAQFPTGPWELAGLMACPVILAVALYRGGNRYDVFFEKLAEVVPPTPRRRPQGTLAWVERYAARLEHYTRLAPLNWFNFYNFWNEDGLPGDGRDQECASSGR